MEKIIGALVLAIMTCSHASAGMAQIAETVPVAAYPDPQCIKPDVKSIAPPQLKDAYDPAEIYNAKARAYNFAVKAFNRDAETYKSCIQAYVDNASREVKRIQNQANADLKRITENSNAAMDAIQGKMKRAAAELNALANTALRTDK